MGGLFAVLSILLGGGNEIAAFYQYLLIGLFLVGFIVPRSAFLLWLVLCGYTDLLKRFLVVTGRVTFGDLYYILGIPPVMLGAITMSVFLGAIIGRFQLRKFHWQLFAVACAIALAMAGLAAKGSGGGGQGILPAIANNGLYFMLIFIVPALFRTTDDVLKVVRLLLWAYLPVAIYGVFQEIYGYLDFEVEYLKSGLSIEVKQLLTGEVRAFSTLNSTTSLATVTAALFSLSIILPFVRTEETGRRALGWPIAVPMALVYFAGMLASTGRAAFALIAFCIFGAVCFRSKRLTVAAYVCSGFGFIALLLSAELLLSNLGQYQDDISGSTGDQQYLSQMTRVGTYSDRLKGFSNLLQSPDVWTLFGHQAVDEDDKSLFSHDILTNSLVQYGAVPVGIAVLLLLIGAMKVHREVLGIQDRWRRSLAATFLALTLSFIVLSMLAGNVMIIFPINVFACLSCGMMLVVCHQDREASKHLAPETGNDFPVLAFQYRTQPVSRFKRTGRAVC